MSNFTHSSLALPERRLHLEVSVVIAGHERTRSQSVALTPAHVARAGHYHAASVRVRKNEDDRFLNFNILDGGRCVGTRAGVRACSARRNVPAAGNISVHI